MSATIDGSRPQHPRRLESQLGLIVLLALALRLLLALQMGNHYYFADTREYERAAQSLLAGHGPGRYFPRAPVYPAFMALGFWMFGGTYTGVRLLQLVVGGLGVVGLSVLLALRIGSWRHALLTALVAGTAPTLVFSSAMLYPTALYSLLLLGITLVARDLDLRPGIGRGLGLGVLCSLSLMTDLVSAVPIAATLLWVATGMRRHALRTVAALGATVLAIALTVLPIVRYYERTYGRAPIFMEKAQTVLWFVRRDPDLASSRVVRDTTSHYTPLTTKQFVRREWGLLRAQPIPYVLDYVSEFVHFWKPMPDRVQTRNVYTTTLFKLLAGAYFIPVLLLAMVGLFAAPVRRRDRILLVVAPLATAATYSLFFTQLRYRVPIEPQLLILATLGGTRLLPQISGLLVGMPPVAEADGLAAARLAGRREARAEVLQPEARP